MANGGKELGDVMVMQRVKDVAPVALGAHEPQRAQDSQMMRGRACRQVSVAGQLLDRPLAVNQGREHPQPAGGAQRLKCLGDLLRLDGVEWTESGPMFSGM